MMMSDVSKEQLDVYAVFEAGLENLKPHFVAGMKLLTHSLAILRELLEEMVSGHAKFYNDLISDETCRHWRDLCEHHLLGPHPKPEDINRARLMQIRTKSITQIRKSVCYQVKKYNNEIFGHAIKKNKKANQSSSPSVVSPVVDKHNAKISQCRVQASTNAKKSKKGNGHQSDECFKNGDLKIFKSDDEDSEESTEYSDDEEDEDVYAEEESEGISTNA